MACIFILEIKITLIYFSSYYGVMCILFPVMGNVIKNLRGGLMDLLWKLFPVYFVLLFLIQLVPVRINLFFERENKNDFISIRVNTFFSLIRFNVEIPVLQQKTALDLTLEAELHAGQDATVHEEKTEVSALDINWAKVQEYLDYVRKNRKALWFMFRFFTRAMTVEKLVLKIRSGMDDAAVTGLISGLYWTLAGTFTALAQQWLKLKELPVFGVTPDFSPNPIFAVRFDSTVSFRIGHFTVGGYLFLVTKFRGGRD